MAADIVESVMIEKDNGRKLCAFFSEITMTRNVAWSSSLHLNKLALFLTKPQQVRSLK
ncbi:MAG: hypothetical protein GY694_22300 [Gammaproteobacteria bacterium]|nr:hypothetical protein [Gammaproteobacteria bacterium]